MKKIFKTLAIVAVAALGFACQNEIDEQVNGNEGEKVTVEVVGSVADLTRSVFGAIDTENNKVSSTWTKDQTVYFAPYQPAEGNITMSEAVVAAAGATASFEIEFTNTQEEGAIHAFSPKGVQNGAGGFTANKVYANADPYIWLNLPANQTTSATSCDEQVHVLYASKEYSGGFPTSVSMDFNHVLAYGKMNITGFEGEIASVAITFPEAVAGGSVKYYYLTNTFTGAAANTITVNNVDDNATIWFGIVPTESGEEKMSGNMTVVVTDSEGNTYTKELATAGKLAFIQGQVSNFTVNMSGIAADGEKDYCGNYNIVAKRSSGNFFYMTSDLGTASTKRFQIVDTGANVIGDVAENADYVWVVEKSGDNYKIKTNDGQYITWSSGNSANLASTGKEMTIKANGNAVNIRLVDTPARYLSLNNNSSSNYFAFYEGTQVNDLYLIPYTGAVVVKEATTIELDTYENTVDIKEGTKAASSKFIEPNATVLDASDVAVEGAELELTYKSSDDKIATVAANGNVTFTGGTGSVTITISYAGDDNYKGCEAEYTIEVTDSTPSEGGSTTLTNANITAIDAATGYRNVTLTDDNGFTYNAYTICNYHSNATKDQQYLQIRAFKSNTDYYIGLPDVGAPIKKITMTVSGSSAAMTGGGFSGNLHLSTTKKIENSVGSGSGSSKVVIDLSGNTTVTTGYIVADAAVRIWDIKIDF